MSLAIRDSAKGVTIRATGADATRLRWAIASALTPEGAENGPQGLPNRSKTESHTSGTPMALRIAEASRSRRGS